MRIFDRKKNGKTDKNQKINFSGLSLSSVIAKIHQEFSTTGKEFGKMKNLSIVILLVFCLFQLNINLFTDKNILNAVSADTNINPEKNIPIIDQNISSNIETATFAMG